MEQPSQPQAARPLSARDWAFAAEIAEALGTYAERLEEMEIDDPLRHLLRRWSISLMLLGREMLDSITTLIKAGHRRAAYGLVRPLIEYYIRLRFYTLEAAKQADLHEAFAFKDFSRASEKLPLLKDRLPELDFSGMTDEQQQIFRGLLDEAHEYRVQRWKSMLDLVESEDEDRKALIDYEYGFTSAYLHGDQLAGFDFEERNLLGAATLYAIMLMHAAGAASGREYGFYHFQRRFAEHFPD